MKDNTAKLFRTIIAVFAFLLLSNHTFSQDFKPQPLITIPGKNTNIDIISPYIFGPTTDTYICWQNEIDSTYTIYLKRITPFDSNNVKIFSSRYPSTNPSIWMEWDSTIHIVWQTLTNNHWQIKSARYSKGTVGKVINVTDSLSNNTDPKISEREIAWIKDSSLVFASFDSVLSKQRIIDTGECANLKLQKNYGLFAIVYEKGQMQNRHIFVALRLGYNSDSWEKEQITTSGNNINPSIGSGLYVKAVTFMSLIGNVWKIRYTSFFNFSNMDTTKNIACNYYNPDYLTYPLLTKETKNLDSFPDKGFFLVFDSDSISSNREIFIQYTMTFTQWKNSQAINISNMPGDDIKPKAFFTKYNYDTSIMIIWEHIEGENTQLWYAKNNYNHPQDVEDGHSNLSGYSLSQNYPNPFNPSTKIRYIIPSLSHVKLHLFDLLGNEIALLVDETKPQGSYEAELNASDYNLSSGIYFYRIQAGKFFETKKLIFLQ